MKSQELENRVLQIAAAAVRGEQIEDSRIELKSDWPDAKKAARRLAAHANSARSDWILWVIGLDEKGRSVRPAREAGFTEWWAKVAAEFESVSLDPQVLSVACDGGTVVALFCPTDRAPYVVRNPDGGAIQFEVPWRVSNDVRSATRAQLLTLLVPLSSVPSVELLGGVLSATYKDGPQGSGQRRGATDVRVSLYVTPQRQERIVFPFHRCRARVQFSDSPAVDLGGLSIHPDFGYTKSGVGGKRESYSPNAEVSQTEVILDGPTRLTLSARSLQPIESFDVARSSVSVEFSLHAVNQPLRSFSIVLKSAGSNGDVIEFSGIDSSSGFESRD